MPLGHHLSVGPDQHRMRQAARAGGRRNIQPLVNGEGNLLFLQELLHSGGQPLAVAANHGEALGLEFVL